MKILYIMSSYNIYGGTPKKTLDLLQYFQKDSSLYVYTNSYKEFKPLFLKTNASIYEGNYGKNIFLHIKKLLQIIDKNNIDIIQTQFNLGELLGYFLKLFRPHIKLIIAFVGSASPLGIKKYLALKIYKNIDAFVYISKYVKQEKIKIFPFLAKKYGTIIYNGSKELDKSIEQKELDITINHPSILDIAGLTNIKNIDILIDAIEILVKDGKEVFLYVAGDGPKKEELLNRIQNKQLNHYIHLLGYRADTQLLLKECDIFVHPCYMEGFGLVVTEAMMANKPIIVAKAGALPELIENNKSGLVVEPFDAKSWAKAIIKLIENKKLAKDYAQNAKIEAQNKFSIEKYISNYKNLYISLMETK